MPVCDVYRYLPRCREKTKFDLKHETAIGTCDLPNMQNPLTTDTGGARPREEK
jgi:hypothetical protein